MKYKTKCLSQAIVSLLVVLSLIIVISLTSSITTNMDISSENVVLVRCYMQNKTPKDEKSYPIPVKTVVERYMVSDPNLQKFIPAEKSDDYIELDGLTKIESIWKLFIVGILTLLLGIMSSWSFSLWKQYKDSRFYAASVLKLMTSDVRTKLKNAVAQIIDNHEWILNYGMSKLKPKKAHYYDVLKLVSKGFKALVGDDKIIKVRLFFPGSLEELKNLRESDTRLEPLFKYWKELSEDERYEIRRFFVCNNKEYEKSVDMFKDWYITEFGEEMKYYNIDAGEEETAENIKSLEGDLDFAIFQEGSTTMCIGFMEQRISYILLDSDNLNGRGAFLDDAKRLLGEK